jgi:hypothetical protein
MTTLTDLPTTYGVVSDPDHRYPVIYWIDSGSVRASKLGEFPDTLPIGAGLRAEIESDLQRRRMKG